MPGLDVVEPPETRRGSYHSLHRSQHAYFGTSGRNSKSVETPVVVIPSIARNPQLNLPGRSPAV